MRARLLITGAVLVLLVAVSLAFCGDDAPGSEGLAAALSPERDVRATSRSVSREKRPLPADDLVEGAEAARRRWPPAAGEAGQTFDGGSLQDFIDEQGRQAIRQWLADNAVAAEKYVDRFCAETKDLAGRKDLGSPPRERDAAGYMAGRSDWEYGRLGMLHLPDSLTQRMGSPPQAWRSAGPELYAGLDFTWMTELLQFDHWSMLAAGPLKDTDGYSYFDAPIPNYVTLQYWVKLRLLKGVHEGNLAQASVEVRHLAELIGSSGTLVSEMIRIALFGIERKTWEDAGLTPPKPIISADEAQRARHAAHAGTYMLYPGVPKAVREKALKCMPMRCTAMLEGLGAAVSLAEISAEAKEDVDTDEKKQHPGATVGRRLRVNVTPRKPSVIEPPRAPATPAHQRRTARTGPCPST